MPDVNEVLHDLAVGHQVGLLRLATRTVRKVLGLVTATHDDVVRKLGDGGTEVSASRLDKLLVLLQRIMGAGYALVGSSIVDDAEALAQYEAEYQAEKIQRTLPVQVSFDLPGPAQLRAAATSRPFQGRFLKEWVADLNDSAYKRVRDAVRIGYTEGETTPDIVRRIRGTRAANYADGVAGVSRRGAEGVVRTALNHTANAAREMTYAENPDLIKGVRWVSTLDLRTTPICRARDGMVFEPNKGPRPPAHWGCRSTTAPITKSWRDMGINLDDAPEGTRASMSGQVPASTTYQTWLERQPASVQDEVLGVTKGALFRRGGVTLDRFVDPRGKEYTIDQLRARDAAAFAAAGL